MPEPSADPFISWVYDAGSDAFSEPMRLQFDKHVRIALGQIQSVLGPLEIEGLIFSNDLSLARDFGNLHFNGQIDLGAPGGDLRLGTDVEWMKMQRAQEPIHEDNAAMMLASMSRPERRLIGAQDVMACWLHPTGRARNPARARDFLGILAHEVGHAQDAARGRPGKLGPDEAEGFDWVCVPTEPARDEYVAVRAECEVENALFGGAHPDACIDIQAQQLKRSILEMSRYVQEPPEDGQRWLESLRNFGYALGTLAAFSDAEIPVLLAGGSAGGRTTRDLVRECLPGEMMREDILEPAAEALRPCYGKQAQGSSTIGRPLLAATAGILPIALGNAEDLAGSVRPLVRDRASPAGSREMR